MHSQIKWKNVLLKILSLGEKFIKPLSAVSVTQTLEILTFSMCPGCEYKDTFYYQGDCTGCSFFV